MILRYMRRSLRMTIGLLVMLWLAASCSLPGAKSGPAAPAGGAGMMEPQLGSSPDIYRGVFGDEAGGMKSTQEVYDKLAAMKKHYFDGSYKIYIPQSDGSACISDVYNDDVRSEGMSYGMMIAVQMNLKDQFKALWKFAKNKMWHTEKDDPRYGYFSRRVKKDGSRFRVKCAVQIPFPPATTVVEIDDPRYLNPAPDGEQYFAMALYLASARWKDDTFKKDADIIIHEMLYKNDVTFAEAAPDPARTVKLGDVTYPVGISDTVTVGRMFNRNSDWKLVCFSPVDDAHGDGPTYTDPSYVLPAFYDYFGAHGTEGRSKWRTIALNGRRFLAKATNLNGKKLEVKNKKPTDEGYNGLCADYTGYDGTPLDMVFQPDPEKNPKVKYNRKQFCWDARRVPLNMALDTRWYPRADENSGMLKGLIAINYYFAKKTGTLGDVYNLDGSEDTTQSWRGDGLESTIGAAAYADIGNLSPSPFATQADALDWTLRVRKTNCNRLWDQALYTNIYDRYYGGCLYMLGFLVASDNFRQSGWKLDLSKE